MSFPRLFAICVNPVILVSAACLDGKWNSAFRRSFGQDEVLQWDRLREGVPLALSQSPDSISWSLSPSGEFFVSSALLPLEHCVGFSLKRKG